jgi:hypothetical protein
MIKIGTAIIYVLSGADALAINRRRTNGASIAARMKMSIPAVDHRKSDENLEGVVHGWPEGAQAHIGNNVVEGMKFPGVVVRDWSAELEASGAGEPENPAVNLQVWLDGTDSYWATSRHEDGSKSPKPGTFSRA